jgi:glycosyltransferase involved in cell wall biosynthesis
MSPYFTVITASLNMGSSLIRTIESIKNQKFQDFEHVVIDGGSSDNTLKILASYDNSYNLKWISEPDQGVPDAFNKAVGLSTGEYIIAIQADDYLLDENVLEKVYEIISAKKNDIYSFPIIKELTSDSAEQINPIQHLWWRRFRNIFPHQGIFVNRKLFDKIGNYDLKYTITEDYDFLYRALNAQSSVSFEKLPVAYMGGDGPCSTNEYLSTRLHEEISLQIKNEKNIVWRLIQIIFWVFYYPFKTRFLFRTLPYNTFFIKDD